MPPRASIFASLIGGLAIAAGGACAESGTGADEAAPRASAEPASAAPPSAAPAHDDARHEVTLRVLGMT